MNDMTDKLTDRQTDTHTHTHTKRQTHDNSIYHASIVAAIKLNKENERK